MSRSLLTRAQNSAASSLTRRKVFDLVVEHRDDLVAAARDGVVPVSVISGRLREVLGSELDNPTLRQYVGLCVVAVLEDAGFSVTRPRVRIPQDPVFGVGALFSRESTKGGKPEPTLLQRFVDALSMEELKEAQTLVHARLTLSPARRPKQHS
ncbi:MAG: hypothetical protein EOS54_04025 [Mesorhizobium sp.]|uniref:hypothetical protein n=1 Tax=unclassified Mesorhizobium TaxID=325217 RepID=UPI000F75D2AB|nr:MULTISPECIES: hypothetical protein [unclassified Mesorhizobium]RVC81776.1 hypothetical protein EN766_02590 [Mesorhizobium sp. M2A.F.Ca.ET.046.02.1.1]AZO33549.1 hypothetical protein EJ072_02725 [Mesorhizobium sp. M2A.F.Ca.ET.046.03.2.1]RWB42763.1 MAG: hypothetical protein EOQ44_20270 [Mesorhizobium sp.]RWC57909.1 MAG: hypothetical protein EOS54_04025 [Mesorhizobium sp.]RWE22019.1 MAG: hypothetical protein EOS76_02910 [Mesorhizobium sp.]